MYGYFENYDDFPGGSALTYAIKKNKKEAAKIISENGGKLNAKTLAADKGIFMIS